MDFQGNMCVIIYVIDFFDIISLYLNYSMQNNLENIDYISLIFAKLIEVYASGYKNIRKPLLQIFRKRKTIENQRKV